MALRHDAAHTPRIAKEQWAFVLDQAPSALAANTLLACVVGLVVYVSNSHPVIGLWLIFHCLNNGARYHAVISQPDHRTNQWTVRKRRLYMVSTVVSGFVWGMLPFLATDSSEVLRLFLYSTVLAMAATTHVTLGGHLKTYSWYVAVMIAPLTIHFFLRGLVETPFLASAAMMLVYSIFLMTSGRTYSKSLSRTLRLSFQNEDLMQRAVDTQLALQQSEARLRRTFEAIGDVVITTNDNFEIDYINRAGENLLGTTLADMQGQAIQDTLQLYDDERLKPVTGDFIEALEANDFSSIDVRCRLKTPDKDHLSDVEISASIIRNTDKSVQGFILTLHDTSEIHQLRRHMSWQAKHDPLTALYNRRAFESRLAGAWYEVLEKQKQHVLCYIDLDNFKQVNDTAGHTTGDAVLTKIAQLMQSTTRNSDMLARLGGDEFGLILYNCDLEQAHKVVETFHQKITAKLAATKEAEYHIGMSIGIALLSDEYHNLEEVVLAADQACYTAKQSGRNQVCVAPLSEARESKARKGSGHKTDHANNAA